MVDFTHVPKVHFIRKLNGILVHLFARSVWWSSNIDELADGNLKLGCSWRRSASKSYLADVVATREFGKRGTLRPALAGLFLLRLRQFRFPAHALPALLRPAAALGGAGDTLPTCRGKFSCRLGSESGGEPRNRAAADAVAFCQCARRLACGEPLPRLLDLVRGEFRLTPHPCALGAGNLSAFMGALDDAQPFVLGHCRHHRHETPPHRGGEV